jgi:CheY-like chemotaxis protein
VKEWGGHIELFSEVGQGSTFKVFLPRHAGTLDSLVEDQPDLAPARRGSETILVVEDEPAVRALVDYILTDSGYHVLSASNGQEALQLADAKRTDKIDLLLTDVVMPQMSGPELADRLTGTRPGMKVLLTSGYVEDLIELSSRLEEGAAFIEKPFRPASLTNKIRQLLDAEGVFVPA